MIPRNFALWIAWACLATTLTLTVFQLTAYVRELAALLPLNLIAAGIFFLVAKRP